jgi:hypothetical protein
LPPGEFGLQKEIATNNNLSAIEGRQGFPDFGIEIMLSLVAGVDGSKSASNGEFAEDRGALFPFQAVP